MALPALPALFVIFMVTLPVGTALFAGLTVGGGSTWDHILANRLLPYTATTLFVLGLSAVLMLAFAVPAAWLVSRYEFPGRRFFSWALILPLAMPGYVMAYAWADLAASPGPLQSALRDATGWSARDYWFPNMSSAPGLAFVLASTLFPYVYITARTAFSMQTSTTLDAAKSLGANAWERFWRVGLPVAIPAICGGLCLALMEAAADYGAADFLGVQTLGVGIIRSWNSFGEPNTAARLALALIMIAGAFFFAAQYLQGRGGTQHTGSKWQTPKRGRLSAQHSAIATVLCTLLLLVCFFVPVSRLIWLSLETRASTADLYPLLRATLILSSLGTGFALIAAFVFTLAAKNDGGLRFGTRLAAAAGYAAPGAVLGLGAVYILRETGQALSASIAILLLLWIYVSRFTSAGVEPLNATLDRLPRNLDNAARSLGSGRLTRIWRIDLPLLAPGTFAAALILFVEILKELPATLMLRPTGWDTLAVRAHAYASDERFAQAMLPSLLIVLAGLAPVLLLSWRLSHSERQP
ncbi:MAG: iron ABC transporter permease [Pseudomonadota bacterium]